MKQHRTGAFVDFVRIKVKAGDGGKGCIAFRREKYVEFGGPNGGDGGRGGSVYLQGDPELVTLLDLQSRTFFHAGNGQHGMGSQCSGKSGEDILLVAPLGTTVTDIETGEELGDLTKPGERICIARGGDGGRGNQHFATATNKAPRKAEAGWPGEERTLVLELKTIADAGFVGLPNAGKSTLLAAMTRATPKIASYPFTTLSPNLGVFEAVSMHRQITLADIPGLIEGAHTGAGLGDRFLRHIERTSVLAHLVGPEAGVSSSGDITELDTRPSTLLYAWELVENELSEYSDALDKKPRVAVLTKTDLMTPAQVKAICAAFTKKKGITLHPISAENGDGIEELKRKIEELVLKDVPRPEPTPTDEEK